MESFKITAKEFLLLCTATDADEVYGVDDAYENLTEDNVEKEVRNAQKSLEEKNYIQSDFDGNSEIRDDLMELISCCVECNNVISVDHAQGNKGQTNVVYYIQDEKVVKSEKKDDIYIIGWLKKEMLYSDIKGLVKILPMERNNNIDKFHIPQNEVERAKESLAKKDKKAAVECFKQHCNTTTAELVANALDINDFYSITEVEFKDKLDSVHNMMVFVTDTSLIKITPTVIDLIDETEFDNTTIAEINDTLDNYVKIVGTIVGEDGLNG